MPLHLLLLLLLVTFLMHDMIHCSSCCLNVLVLLLVLVHHALLTNRWQFLNSRKDLPALAPWPISGMNLMLPVAPYVSGHSPPP
jgi:hypothetical protein